MDVKAPSNLTPDDTVVVTGASGFIGGRIVELLALNTDAQVVPLVRSWTSAARLARLGMSLKQAELTSSDLKPILADATHIIHCAYASPHSAETETARLLTEAVNFCTRLKSVVHLSTTEVYGSVAGEVGEDHPLLGQSPYARAKIACENWCRRIAPSVPFRLVVLRPSIVYGPFSKLWTVRLTQQLVSGYLDAVRTAAGCCQPIYVDDVAEAALASLTLPKEHAGNQVDPLVLNVAGNPTAWSAFFDSILESLEMSSEPPRIRRLRSSPAMSVLATAARRVLSEVSTSGRERLAEYARTASLTERAARSWEAAIRLTPTRAEHSLFRRRTRYAVARARLLLALQPLDLTRGLERAALWLRYHRYV